MAWGKDVERLARSFVKQHLDVEYIRYYLMEQYQLDKKSCEQLLLKIGAVKPPQEGQKGPPKPGEKDKVKREGFF